MENSITIAKDSVTILVPVVTGYIILFTGSIGKLWLEHRKDLIEKRIVLIFSGLSVVVGILSISFCMGVMSLLFEATLGSEQATFWMGILDSNGLIKYAYNYLMIGWSFFVLAIAFGLTAYTFLLKEVLTKESSRPPLSSADS